MTAYVGADKSSVGGTRGRIGIDLQTQRYLPEHYGAGWGNFLFGRANGSTADNVMLLGSTNTALSTGAPQDTSGIVIGSQNDLVTYKTIVIGEGLKPATPHTIEIGLSNPSTNDRSFALKMSRDIIQTTVSREQTGLPLKPDDGGYNGQEGENELGRDMMMFRLSEDRTRCYLIVNADGTMRAFEMPLVDMF
jgi:hypothetical protein